MNPIRAHYLGVVLGQCSRSCCQLCLSVGSVTGLPESRDPIIPISFPATPYLKDTHLARILYWHSICCEPEVGERAQLV